MLQSVAELLVLRFPHCGENAYDQMFPNAAAWNHIPVYKSIHTAWILEA